MKYLFYTLCCGVLFSSLLYAADDSLDRNYAEELPRIAPLEPDQVAASFEVHPGFEMQLVAAEPLVHDPIAMAFDEKGRLFVVEMRGYSERRDEMLGAVRLLTDTDGDGVYDKSDVYVDGLAWPTAVACFDGGIFVAEPPNIFYCKDTDGDSKADEKEIVYTGFGLSNVQGMVNTFKWGLDNRIHGATSSSGAEMVRTDDPTAPPLSLRGRDFSFDPRTRDIRAESGGGQHGLTFDEVGRKFVCHNSDHIMQIMYDDARTVRNPYMQLPGVRRSIASDGPAADVFRISPVEPWREVRTRLRVQGLVPGPIEGGGTAAGYFTSATGITVYKGDAWPEEYKGNVFIGDVGSNLIHRKYFEEAGIQLTAHRADPGTEFVRSTDIWFRPVQFCNSPDGSLFVADMYREVIEHPDSLPPIIKQHLDLNSGQDRGRIYRIVPVDFKQPKIPDMSKMTTEELVAYLDHPNAWHRETASRLIYERRDKVEAIKAIEKLLESEPSPLGYIHGLYALDGLAAITTNHIQRATESENPWVKVHALRLAEKLHNKGGLENPGWNYEILTADDDVNVRYEVAFSLAYWPIPSAYYALIDRDIENEWIRFALTSSTPRGVSGILLSLLKDNVILSKMEGRAYLLDIAYYCGAIGRANAQVFSQLDLLEDASFRNKMLTSLFDGMKDSNIGGLGEKLKESPSAMKILQDMLATARKVAVNDDAAEKLRIEALNTLTLDVWENAAPLIKQAMVHPQSSSTIRAEALETLGAFPNAEAVNVIIEAWPVLSPPQRMQAIEILFAREDRLIAMLDAIENKQFDFRALDSNRRKALINHSNPDIRARAEKYITAVESNRDEVVTRYMPVFDLQGNVEKGKAIFMENCASCHRLGGEGFAVGPDLVTVAQAGAEKILVNVLDPNREINPQYINYTIETDDYESHSGIIAEESATTITLKRANGETDNILRGSIDKISSSEMSIMPEGLEENISIEQMADLIAYITVTN